MRSSSQFLFGVLLILVSSVSYGQRILLVDNNPGAPADDGKVNSFVYNDLASALSHRFPVIFCI